MCVSTRPFRRCAKPGSARRKRDVAGARIKSAEAARHNASAAKRSLAKRGCAKSGPVTASRRCAPLFASGIRGSLHIAAN